MIINKTRPTFCFWLTGLPCSGKTTIAKKLDEKLNALSNVKSINLDGDLLRETLSSDLSFSEKDREEANRRASQLAYILQLNKITSVVSMISPTNHAREEASKLFPEDTFKLIYLSTPLNVCKSRDVKGHYRKAENGQIANFTGLSSEFEIPENYDLKIDTTSHKIDECVDLIMNSFDYY